MATHSSVLAWRIPGTGEPGGLPSMGSHRVGPDSSDLAAAVTSPLEKEIATHSSILTWRIPCETLCFSVSPLGLVRTLVNGPAPGLQSQQVWVSLRICISNRVLGTAAAATAQGLALRTGALNH